MEAKKFISTLKGFKTRFTKTPNKELELKSVQSLVDKFGGREAALSAVKDNEDLTCYIVLVMPLATEESKETKTPKKSSKKTSAPKEEERFEVTTGKDGKTYKIDKVKKTCKRIFKDFSELAAIELPEMDMQVYQKYLRDKFPDEDMPIKKGKLHFRGYRISCTIDSGFVIEDTTKKYAIVDTPWEGIPSPRELGDFFKRPTREFTPEEMKKAVQRGKELAEKSKKNEEVGLETLREKVLELLKAVRLGHETGFDPTTLPSMIPFKRWQKQVKSLLSQWKERKIRYPKFLAEVERITTEETFEAKEKKVVVKFSGTCLPDFEKVGRLVGDKLEVDDKLVDAVPFMLDYILHYEPKAMQQVMRYAKGECTDVFLLKNPYHKDNTIEYDRKALENTPSNAQLLTALCASIGLVAPQDLLYEADLEVGDKILIDIDGEWKTKQIMGKDKGYTMSKEVGLLKLDKWIKLPKGE